MMFEEIDPEGDVTLIISEEGSPPLDHDLGEPPTPPGLDFRRSHGLGVSPAPDDAQFGIEIPSLDIEPPPPPVEDVSWAAFTSISKPKKGKKKKGKAEPEVEAEPAWPVSIPAVAEPGWLGSIPTDEAVPEPPPELAESSSVQDAGPAQEPEQEPEVIEEAPAEDQANERPSEITEKQSDGPPPESPPNEPSTDDFDADAKFLVSSKHLTFASPTFKRSLAGAFLEGQTLKNQGHVKFTMRNQNADAMLIVLNIIHGRTRKVPRALDLTTLTRIAVLVDYLECHEAVELFSDTWIENLNVDTNMPYSKELIQWLCISLVFRKAKIFSPLTRTAIVQSKEEIETFELPIRPKVVDVIQERRCDAILRLLTGLTDLLGDLQHDRIQCTFECNAMRFGALSKELDHRHLLSPAPQFPFRGYSFRDMVASVGGILDPQFYELNTNGWGSNAYKHGCGLKPHISTIIASIEKDIKGLDLDDFKEKREG